MVAPAAPHSAAPVCPAPAAPLPPAMPGCAGSAPAGAAARRAAGARAPGRRRAQSGAACGAPPRWPAPAAACAGGAQPGPGMRGAPAAQMLRLQRRAHPPAAQRTAPRGGRGRPSGAAPALRLWCRCTAPLAEAVREEIQWHVGALPGQGPSPRHAGLARTSRGAASAQWWQGAAAAAAACACATASGPCPDCRELSCCMTRPSRGQGSAPQSWWSIWGSAGAVAISQFAAWMPDLSDRAPWLRGALQKPGRCAFALECRLARSKVHLSLCSVLLDPLCGERS